MGQWSSGGLQLSAADLEEIDLGDDAVLTFGDTGTIDDSEYVIGDVNDIINGAEAGDIWVFNVQCGIIGDDDFQDWALIFYDDNDDVLFQAVMDEEGINATFVFTGSDVIGDGSAPGVMDIEFQQADPTNGAVQMSLNTQAVRLRRRHSDTVDFPAGESGHETFDS